MELQLQLRGSLVSAVEPAGRAERQKPPIWEGPGRRSQ